MYNYAAAGPWADIVRALVMTENGGVEPATTNIEGDGGRAIGILQQHPAFFAENYGKCHLFPQSVDDDYSTAQIKAAASFFQVWVTGRGPGGKGALSHDLAVQAYNQGVQAVLSGVRAPDYLARFGVMKNRIGAQWPNV